MQKAHLTRKLALAFYTRNIRFHARRSIDGRLVSARGTVTIRMISSQLSATTLALCWYNTWLSEAKRTTWQNERLRTS